MSRVGERMLKRADCTYPWWSKNVEASMYFTYTRMPLEVQSESSFAILERMLEVLTGGMCPKYTHPKPKT